MAKLEYANSFRDLIVYRKARELFLAIFKLTERFPKKEDYSLTDQKYISQEEANQLLEKCTEIGRLLGGMMAKAEQFCKPLSYKTAEERADYFVDSPVTH